MPLSDVTQQEGDAMEVHPKKPTAKGPTEWFTGDVWIDGPTCLYSSRRGAVDQ